MASSVGFDNEKYLEEQSLAIVERSDRIGGRLYLEFGGKIAYDFHAARVLPGYDPNVKIRLLQKLKDQAEIVVCIYAGAIERRKMRADFGIPYDVDALKLIDDLRDWGLLVRAVVITRFEDQPSARVFKARLERRGIPVYAHRSTSGYPTDVDRIVSDEGYGANDYIPTERPVVVVAGPGPGSGKLATCLSQVYHEHRRGNAAGYAKFETFPIWNLPLKHPVNVAYEAATVELQDVNQIDPFHLEAYGEQAVNYNRDIEAFPLVARILQRIGGDAFYRSPTDMGVNRAGFAIVDDAVVRAAAEQEVIRRHFRYACEYAVGLVEREDADRARLIMNELGLDEDQRVVVQPRARGGRRGRGKRQGQRGRLLRRRHRPARRPHRHRQELHADARRLRRGAERREAPVAHPGRHAAPDPERHGVDRRDEEGHPADEVGEPRPRRDADRPRHQRHHQPSRPGGRGAA